MRKRFGILPGFLIVLDDAVDCLVNVTNSDTSLAMISASTCVAVLICVAPPLSANKPDKISSWTDCSAGSRTPPARRCAIPALADTESVTVYSLIEVVVNKAIVVRLPRKATKVAVTQPQIAEVVVVAPDQL